jgi:cold shock CspA family protein
MNGVVTAIIRRSAPGAKDGGYGFIRDEENQERFFHARNLRGIALEQLTEGTAVSFSPVNSGGRGNGLRAESVQCLS